MVNTLQKILFCGKILSNSENIHEIFPGKSHVYFDYSFLHCV
ncbi:hypothetical protein M093_3236 [Bacteroides uniformis str. 3978 T3 i]|uniref:Uncharacterized protein n=1 Tax=Bacteroides uniformis (strain ATCC 8492 / DSM 6597 / CCUG 4942 / CIP 103695 / JCM 5828 / KCTC 5204 / NCTC 13054 / VPI 0061) TaxID=411479 RepID=A0ABC9NAZ8_BACUC|nr:hypothetical protein BACUNI_02575 [Bacteroides uniformis ATCC 8492]KDS58475.1 hypothetical protein M093_3236 [Bacteroides uniformis str. 3978 T3 i]